MTYVLVHCPDCQGVDVVRYGKQRHGPQRSCCNNTACPRHIFLLEYRNHGRLPAVKQQIVDMALNGSGIQWQWDPRYRPCFKDQSDDSHQHP